MPKIDTHKPKGSFMSIIPSSLSESAKKDIDFLAMNTEKKVKELAKIHKLNISGHIIVFTI